MLPDTKHLNRPATVIVAIISALLSHNDFDQMEDNRQRRATKQQLRAW
jgi:hypothetical protein